MRDKQRAELLLQVERELFVGIECEDPFAEALLDGKVLLGGEAGPGALNDAGSVVAGDLLGVVGRAGVDNDDLVGPLNTG